jgi:hypothetical protein
MAERAESGVLDTCAYIDLDVLDPTALPRLPEITSITLAELYQGVAMSTDASTRAARAEKLGAAVADFDRADDRGGQRPASTQNGPDDRGYCVDRRPATLHPQRRRFSGSGRPGHRRRGLTERGGVVGS